MKRAPKNPVKKFAKTQNVIGSHENRIDFGSLQIFLLGFLVHSSELETSQICSTIKSGRVFFANTSLTISRCEKKKYLYFTKNKIKIFLFYF